MGKTMIFITAFAFATNIFAENEKISCESDFGTCSYEISLSDHRFIKECTCYGGYKISDGKPIEEAAMPANEEECLTDLEESCEGTGFMCDNEAGWCLTSNDSHYKCTCIGLTGVKTGFNEDFSAEGCTAVLEKECGTDIATPRFVCTDSEILNACISYEQTLANSCMEPITDEELAAALDTPIIGAVGREGEMASIIAQCCENSILREKHQTFSECIDAAESCANKECCEPCGLILDESEWMDGASEEDEDAANTEAPTTGTTPEDTADGDSAPATDEAPAEKEESKSDGCSMLFI